MFMHFLEHNIKKSVLFLLLILIAITVVFFGFILIYDRDYLNFELEYNSTDWTPVFGQPTGNEDEFSYKADDGNTYIYKPESEYYPVEKDGTIALYVSTADPSKAILYVSDIDGPYSIQKLFKYYLIAAMIIFFTYLAIIYIKSWIDTNQDPSKYM